MSSAAETTRRRKSPTFRRRDALHAHSLHFGPNMTPMVDVVMVILVFFMASAAFVGPEWFMRVLLPQSLAQGPAATSTSGPGAATPTEEPVRITIRLSLDAAGQQTLSTGQGLSNATIDAMGDKLKELVAGLKPDEIARRVEILLIPDAKVPYREVVRLHERATNVGIFRVGYSTEAEGTK